MEQITACFLGTTMPHRKSIAEEAITALDNCIDIELVTNKLAAIDLVPRTASDIATFAHYLGWSTICKPIRPSMQAQFDLLEAAYSLPGDWILYCEDDVIVKSLPDSEEFHQMIDTRFKDDNRKPGMISLMHGGFSRGEETKQAHADWLNNISNWSNVYGGGSRLSWLLKRSDELRDAHFFEFPVTIVRKDIFLACNLWAQKNNKGVHSETALSNAWFALGYNRDYLKMSWLRKGRPPVGEWTFNDYDNYMLQKLLFVECFGNSERLRRVPVTGGISMSF